MLALDKPMVVSEEYKEAINCETIYLTFSLKNYQMLGKEYCDNDYIRKW